MNFDDIGAFVAPDGIGIEKPRETGNHPFGQCAVGIPPVPRSNADTVSSQISGSLVLPTGRTLRSPFHQGSGVGDKSRLLCDATTLEEEARGAEEAENTDARFGDHAGNAEPHIRALVRGRGGDAGR